MNRSVAIAVGILVLVGAAAWWFLRGTAEPPPATPAPVAEVQPAPEPAAPPPMLPELADSDGMTRGLADGFGVAGPMGAELLGQDDLIGRFVHVVDAIASGSSPAGELWPLAPEQPFAVTEIGEQVFLDPDSYARYDDVGAAIAGIDAEAAVAAYRQIEPLADQAYSDIVGQPSAFRPVLQAALAQLLAVPVVSDPPELIDAINRYRFADATLEGLSLPQKHLLRMGPANVGRIQARLRQLSRLLD